MPKPLRISPIALDSTNRMVLKVAVDLVNDEGIACELLPDNSLEAELLVIDTDNEDGQQLLTKTDDSQMKLVICQERLRGKNIVWREPPVRVIDMKELLILICRPMMVAAASQSVHEPSTVDNGAVNPVEQQAAEAIAQETEEAAPPTAEMPGVESPAIERLEAESPVAAVAENPAGESPVAEIPLAEDPQIEAPAPPLETPAAEVPTLEDAAEPPPEETAPRQNLFLTLLNARQQKTCHQISFGEYCLLVGGHNGTVAVSHDQDAKDVLILPFTELHIEPIDAVAFDIAAQKLNISALDNLLWQAGVDHSDGRLLEGHSLKQAVRLKAWPNFTRNGFRQSHFKLAAILARQPISLEALGKQADVPEKDVISFYNSAYAIGLIDRSATPPDTAVQNPPPRKRRKSLIGMLARKLGFR